MCSIYQHISRTPGAEPSYPPLPPMGVPPCFLRPGPLLGCFLGFLLSFNFVTPCRDAKQLRKGAQVLPKSGKNGVRSHPGR